MNDDEKVCPRCAETIKRAAVVCRFCGCKFSAPAPGKPVSKFVGGAMIAALVLVAFAYNMPNIIEDWFLPDPVRVALPDLEKQFDADTPGALAYWRGKPMILSATVISGEGENVALESINPMAVYAELNHQLRGHSGERIELHCRGIAASGFFNDKPRLRNCDVVALGL